MSKNRRRPRGPRKTPVTSKASTFRLGTNWMAWAILLIVIVTVIGYLLLRDSTPKFSGENAFEHLVAQTAFGPRVPGSEAHAATREYLVNELRKYADDVSEQPFTYTDRGDTTILYEAVNIVASFNLAPENGKRVLLGAHWDSRPYADQDPDSSRHKDPVPGANDGASGTAVLLEIARLLHETPPEIGIDIILFDLEDLGEYDSEGDPLNRNRFCIGSRHFVENNPQYKPSYGILLDMVGDSDLRIPMEQYSRENAMPVVNLVWDAAERVGADAFVREDGPAVFDDHVPFLQNDIPMIDVIDFDYPYWHTVEDTADKCSPLSLWQVGQTVVEVIYSDS